MESIKVFFPLIFTLPSLSFAYNDFGSLNYEIKRIVPKGPNPIKSPGTPPMEHPIVFNDFDFLNYEIKRKVPSGPNPIQSPGSYCF